MWVISNIFIERATYPKYSIIRNIGGIGLTPNCDYQKSLLPLLEAVSNTEIIVVFLKQYFIFKSL